MTIPGLSPSDQQILDLVLKERGYALPSPSGGAVDPLLAIGAAEAVAPGALKSVVGSAPDPRSFKATTNNYRANPRGNLLGDAMMAGADLAGTAAGKYMNIADPFAKKAQLAILQKMGGVGSGGGGLGSGIARFAGSKGALNALRAVPGIGLAGAALGVGDIVLGGDSAANKVMDGAMMAGGAALGSVIPVVGTAVGAGLGKMASDGLQFVFGGGKSAEEQKMEAALRMLQTGGMY